MCLSAVALLCRRVSIHIKHSIVSLCLFRTHFPSSLASPQDEECSRQLQLDPDTRPDVEEMDRELSVTFQRDQLPIMTVSLNAKELRNGTAFLLVLFKLA